MTASSYCKANITRLLHIFKEEAKLVMALTPTKIRDGGEL